MFGPTQIEAPPEVEQAPEPRLPKLRTWRVTRGNPQEVVVLHAHSVIVGDEGRLTFIMFKPDPAVQGVPPIPVRGFSDYDSFEEITPVESSILVQ